VEEAALSKEKDKASQERLDDVRKEVAALQDELQPLLSRYNKERGRLQELRRLRKKREDLQVGMLRC
jgi:ATP-dependent Clp protease ATP-binding subunit ClpB